MNRVWQRHGVTREVFLIGRWAVKLPKLTSTWRNFLQGLLCNMQEVEFSKLNYVELCPISLYLPGGILVVMPRCRPLTEQEWYDYQGQIPCTEEETGEKILPVEMKQDSYGVLDGRIVAVDYGS